jgi:hypothetical protein
MFAGVPDNKPVFKYEILLSKAMIESYAEERKHLRKERKLSNMYKERGSRIKHALYNTLFIACV